MVPAIGRSRVLLGHDTFVPCSDRCGWSRRSARDGLLIAVASLDLAADRAAQQRIACIDRGWR